MNGSLLFNDTALRVGSRGLRSLADHVNTLDDGTLLFGINGEDFTFLALVIARVDYDDVSFFDMQFSHCLL